MADPPIDEIDAELIRHLQLDGRRPYTQLAREVGLSEAAVRQRVQRLLEHGVMQIVAVTDPLQLGLHRQAMILIEVDGDVREVAAALEQFDEVDYLVLTAGSVDILAEVFVPDDADLPDDTKLWAHLIHASGGIWKGCVYDEKLIRQRLHAT